ncbi:hypothetical protein Dimus_030301 [Dionaea muscipula]
MVLYKSNYEALTEFSSYNTMQPKQLLKTLSSPLPFANVVGMRRKENWCTLHMVQVGRFALQLMLLQNTGNTNGGDFVFLHMSYGNNFMQIFFLLHRVLHGVN